MVKRQDVEIKDKGSSCVSLALLSRPRTKERKICNDGFLCYGSAAMPMLVRGCSSRPSLAVDVRRIGVSEDIRNVAKLS